MNINKLPDGKMLDVLSSRMATQFQLPAVYDDALSYQGLIYKLMQYIQDTIQNVSDWNDWLKGFVEAFDANLQAKVTETIQGWIDDGTINVIVSEAMQWELDQVKEEFNSFKTETINNINNKLDASVYNHYNVINILDYSPSADGVTNDFEIFRTAFNDSIEQNKFLFIPKTNLPYFLSSNSTVPIPSLYSNGAEIVIEGSLGFDISQDNWEIKGLNIYTDQGGGYGVDDNTYGSGLFTSTSTSVKNITIRDVIVTGIVESQRRIGSCFSLPKITGNIDVSNLKVYNCISGIGCYRGCSSISLNNIIGSNVETLIHAGGYSKSFNANNMRLFNSFEDYQWYVGKNAGKGNNGKDLLLITDCIRGSFTSISDIHGEYCIERVVYSFAHHLIGDNLSSYNTGGFKFVGKTTQGNQVDNRIDYVYVRNLLFRTDNTDAMYTVTDIYGAENITFENLKIFFDVEDYPSSSLGSIRVLGNNGKVRFVNLEVHNRPYYIFGLNEGSTEELTIKGMLVKGNNYAQTNAPFIKNATEADARIGKFTLNDVVFDFPSSQIYNYLFRNYNEQEKVSDNLIVNNLTIPLRQMFVGLDDIQSATNLTVVAKDKSWRLYSITQSLKGKFENFIVQFYDYLGDEKIAQYSLVYNKNNQMYDLMYRYLDKETVVLFTSDSAYTEIVSTVRLVPVVYVKIKSNLLGEALFMVVNRVATPIYNSNPTKILSEYVDGQDVIYFTVDSNNRATTIVRTLQDIVTIEVTRGT